MKQKEISAYLERLGMEEGRADSHFLRALIRAHLEKIPFENLDIFDFGKVPDLDGRALFEKIVRQKRGGVCFELNMLFYLLLESLGYRVYPVAARVLWNKDFIPPLTHMGNIVSTEDGRWYCDVGYGGPGPKGILSLEMGEQEVAGDRFRLTEADGGDIRIEGRHGGEWKGLLQFADRPVKTQDFQVMNYYCARNPIIMFTQKRIINLCTPDGSKALTDMELTIREKGAVHKTVYNNMDELERGLRREFGIRASLADSIRKGEQL